MFLLSFFNFNFHYGSKAAEGGLKASEARWLSTAEGALSPCVISPNISSAYALSS
jgi:hypothetical protein